MVYARYTRAGAEPAILKLSGDPFEICNAVRARLFPEVPLPERDAKFDAVMTARNARARQVPAKATSGNAVEEPAKPTATVATALPGAGVRDTSMAAYRALHWSGKLTEQQREVLQLFDGGKQPNWTRQELARETGLGINVVCGRVNELLHEPIGVLEECGKRACRVTGEIVHALRPRAASVMEKAA